MPHPRRVLVLPARVGLTNASESLPLPFRPPQTESAVALSPTRLPCAYNQDWTFAPVPSRSTQATRFLESTKVPSFERCNPHPRRADTQPEEHQLRHSPRSAHRRLRCLRLGQELARLRHYLCRGPAPLRRIAFSLRAPVPRAHRKTRRGPHRRPRPGHRHQTEKFDP